MKGRQHILAKLMKWYQRAEECTDRSQVDKILRKAKKHARRLAELDQEDHNEEVNTQEDNHGQVR